MFSEYHDILARKYTLSELAEEAGIGRLTLARRLCNGCPLHLALIMPERMNFLDVQNDDGINQYTISEITFCGTEEELLDFISKNI